MRFVLSERVDLGSREHARSACQMSIVTPQKGGTHPKSSQILSLSLTPASCRYYILYVYVDRLFRNLRCIKMSEKQVALRSSGSAILSRCTAEPLRVPLVECHESSAFGEICNIILSYHLRPWRPVGFAGSRRPLRFMFKQALSVSACQGCVLLREPLLSDADVFKEPVKLCLWVWGAGTATMSLWVRTHRAFAHLKRQEDPAVTAEQ